MAGRTVLLEDALPVLETLPSPSADDATAVLRAARLYRQAVWVADDDPELAWLLLVSAMEVAAGRHAAGEDDPAAKLEVAMPGLTRPLREAGGDDLLAASHRTSHTS